MTVSHSKVMDKIEQGFTPAYQKKFKGVRTPQATKEYRANYGKIDWSKK